MDALQEKRETDVASMTNQVLEEMVSPRKTDDWRRRVINALRHTINELKSLAYMRGHVRADLDSAGSSAIATAFLEEACETLDDETLRRLRKGALQRLNHSNGITHE
jgi:c-di-AMP phosphodiesterase-like protein